MRKSALLVTTCLLAACAGGQGDIPPPTVAYVPAQEVDPSAPVAAPHRPVPITAENPIPAPKVKEWKSASAKTAAANKSALQTAMEGEYDGAVLNYEYRHGRRYRVVVDGPSGDDGDGWGKDADATNITLGQDDGSEPDITIGGDPDWFSVNKVGTGIEETSMRAKRDKARSMSQGTYTTQITVKCFKRGVRTTLTIGTGARNYIFDLQCANSHGGNNYNHAVEFTYAHDQQISTYQPPARQAVTRAAPIVADTRYTVEGPDEWRPREWTAWNDGANTHVRPSPAVTSRPVPMLSASASFHIEPATGEYIITGLPPEIRFPWGETALIVRRTP